MSTSTSSQADADQAGDNLAAVPDSGTHNASPSMRRSLFVVVLVALLVRLLCLTGTQHVPTVSHLVGDAAGYDAWARKIADGGVIGSTSFYQAPLYPYTLGAVYALFGPDAWVMRIVQAFWGAAATGLLAWGVGRWFNRRCGLVAGLMWALYAPAIFYDGIIQKAALSGLLVCALMAAIASLQCHVRGTRTLLTGCLLGLLVLTRENALIWIPLVTLWIWWPRGAGVRLPRKKSTALCFIGVLFILGSVALRNRVVGGEWSFSTFQAGPNFYIGNQVEADGRYRPLVKGHETPAFERQDATRLAQGAVGRLLSPREVSQYWMSRAIADVRSNPQAWIKLLGTKTLMVWNAYEVPDVESLAVHAAYSPPLTLLSQLWHFGYLAPLACVGMMVHRRQWRRHAILYALLLSMTAAVALFYVMGRYRYPLAPLLIPFAAAGAVWLWETARHGAWRSMMVPLLAGVLFAGVVNWPIHPVRQLDAMAFMNAGVALAKEGEIGRAAILFQHAVDVHPSSGEANLNLAQVLALQHHYDEAVGHYERARAVAPSLPGLDYNLGVALESVGRTTEAKGAYGRALELNPSDREAQRALDRLLHP